MFAIIETGGKQYQVRTGDSIFVEKMDAAADDEITIDKVLSVVDDDGKVSVGTPYLKGASVKATLLKNGKAKKITVFTYRPKKDSKRKLGHRQPYSRIRIDEISF